MVQLAGGSKKSRYLRPCVSHVVNVSLGACRRWSGPENVDVLDGNGLLIGRRRVPDAGAWVTAEQGTASQRPAQLQDDLARLLEPFINSPGAFASGNQSNGNSAAMGPMAQTGNGVRQHSTDAYARDSFVCFSV